MVENYTINRLWNEWLDKKQPVVNIGDKSVSNRERYEDITQFMELAFYAGFEAKLKYTTEENLQK
jgi:hypothetical protein